MQADGHEAGGRDRHPYPGHVAIIMDGNGRWARRRGMPRKAGHRAGVKALRRIVEACAKRRIPLLTVFAFSSENWNRPRKEVGTLMNLMIEALDREVAELAEKGVRLRFIGDRDALSPAISARMREAEKRTRRNTTLQLIVALAYGGRWDMVQAARQMAAEAVAGELAIADIDDESFAARMGLGDLPDPDMLIRTGGEFRISNFLLWHLAYTECYFTDVLWPDFDPGRLDDALAFYAARSRRFGRTPEQIGET